MRCKICEKDSNFTCICGFCQECLKIYGHEECSEMAKITNNINCSIDKKDVKSMKEREELRMKHQEETE